VSNTLYSSEGRPLLWSGRLRGVVASDWMTPAITLGILSTFVGVGLIDGTVDRLVEETFAFGLFILLLAAFSAPSVALWLTLLDDLLPEGPLLELRFDDGAVQWRLGRFGGWETVEGKVLVKGSTVRLGSTEHAREVQLTEGEAAALSAALELREPDSAAPWATDLSRGAPGTVQSEASVDRWTFTLDGPSWSQEEWIGKGILLFSLIAVLAAPLTPLLISSHSITTLAALLTFGPLSSGFVAGVASVVIGVGVALLLAWPTSLLQSKVTLEIDQRTLRHPTGGIPLDQVMAQVERRAGEHHLLLIDTRTGQKTVVAQGDWAAVTWIAAWIGERAREAHRLPRQGTEEDVPDPLRQLRGEATERD